METALASPIPWHEPELDLVRRMAAGDEHALRSLYAAYGRRLYAYAFRLTQSHQVAEEVVQDTLLAAWRGAGRFRGQARVVTWLLGIVHHQALNATRRAVLPSTGFGQAVEVSDPQPVPEAQAQARDRERTLAAALEELSPEHRAVLELVFYQALSLAEVAEVCGCPLGTVKSRLSYAKARLRAALARAGLGAEDM